MKKLTAIVLLAGGIVSGKTQPARPSYPSLLWEISGNGLSKPSYLFGSMHVSNKMVFHLSDSFYTAIASCDMISLEVDPKEWQPDMFRLEQARNTIAAYSTPSDNDYLTEADFRLKNYQDALRAALREDPMVVNGLLYRTNASQANFQENTYLDLYIYQTARKLGKTATGVENYLETERLSEESALASLKEKRERKILPEGESEGTILNKLQDAYRRGDLSLLDSLNEILSSSKAFNEKFMYPRNEIQANAIDSIIRHRSLFVAVGAAHLPGNQGVIERLRKKGYAVRPVKMTDQDARSREAIDKMHVPVDWRPVTTADGSIQCLLPGPWFRRGESLYNESWQYADMENGSYYMLTRVRTNGAMNGENSETVKMKIDSLLYDNIPGKILQKKEIRQDGYPGFEIINKTRVGDLQRYRIFVTPFEVLLFKMSGNEDYVSGEVADRYFNSIQLKAPIYLPGWTDYAPAAGGFRAVFPQQPHSSINKTPQDRSSIWQYDASAATGEAYLLLKKNVNNSHFLEEDTLDLSLVEESLKGSVSLSREISRKIGKLDGYDCLDMTFARKDGGRLRARAVIRGTDYFLLLASARDDKNGFSKFFDGFHLTEYKYAAPVVYTDTARRFTVLSPVSPRIEKDLQAIVPIDGGNRYPSVMQERGIYSSTPYNQFASFRDDSTGESVQVAVSRMPLYFYRKDSLKFWDNEMHWTRLKNEFILAKKDYFRTGDSLCGYRYTLLDTNTNRKIEGLVEVMGNTIYRVTAVTDQLQPESAFIRDFFGSFRPLPQDGISLFQSKSSLFFRQYFSPDSLTRKITREAVDHIIPEMHDLPALEETIARLDPRSDGYIAEKTRLILALGRIPNAHSMDPLVSWLQRIYNKSDDTSAFRNAVILSMSRIKKPAAYALLKDWLLEATPVFENTSELQDLFRRIGDDTTLSVSLFPEILRLTSIDDYKAPVVNLLSTLADSGRIRKEAYVDYFTNLFADARILLKKQQMADDRVVIKDEDEPAFYPYDNFNLFSPDMDPLRRTGSRGANNRLSRYVLLLIPFYDRLSVPRFFEQVLATKSLRLRLETAVLMIRNGRPVPDSVLLSLAADDEYRADLFTQLDKAGRPDLFPAAYRNQEAMARANLVHAARYEKPSLIQAAGKKWVSTPTVKGYAWFFKYKLKDESAWLMAISGVQPEKAGEVNGNHFLVTMTNRKLTDDSPEQQQFEKRLQQLLLSKRKSALRFFQASTALR